MHRLRGPESLRVVVRYKGIIVSANQREEEMKPIDRVLTEFFQAERPRTWPRLPELVAVHQRSNRRFARARLLLVAALLLACVGLSALGEVPGTWPAASPGGESSKLEAKRTATSKAPATLPGQRLPADQVVKP
jgi:hypothetical protein